MNDKREQFRRGDVVKLKSGGPQMTVTTVNDADGTLNCGWFCEREYKTYSFPVEGLVLIPPDKIIHPDLEEA